MLIVFTYLIVAILGLSIGSFINVLIYRLPIILGLETSQNDNLSIYKPRSFCPICNVKIPLYRNIPVFSFIFQKGRCAECKEKISLIYPFIEILTSLVFIVLFLINGPSIEFIFYSLSISILLSIAVIDIEHRIIPNSLSITLLLLGFVYSIFSNNLDPISSFLGAVIGFSIFYSITIIYSYIKEQEGLGIGDAKLLAAIGSNLGLQAIPMILLFTSLIGILIGLFYYKNSNQKSFFKLSIPLAPSLSISYVLYLLIN
jgi:leader peptidase (prepilin peptidase)/N-methyltransferase|tara:strand:- start:509 stop:1282 length:774 start_codon:yes stop_codon:yes gene_type:complete